MRGRWEAERATLREDWGKGAGKGSKQKWKATWRQRCVSDDMFRHNSVFLPGHIWERVHERIAKPFGVLGVCVCVCVCVCRGGTKRETLCEWGKKKRDWEKTHFEHCLCALWPVLGEYLGQPCCFKMDRKMNVNEWEMHLKCPSFRSLSFPFGLWEPELTTWISWLSETNVRTSLK